MFWSVAAWVQSSYVPVRQQREVSLGDGLEKVSNPRDFKETSWFLLRPQMRFFLRPQMLSCFPTSQFLFEHFCAEGMEHKHQTPTPLFLKLNCRLVSHCFLSFEGLDSEIAP